MEVDWNRPVETAGSGPTRDLSISGRTSRLSFPSRPDFNSGIREDEPAIGSLEAGKEKAVPLKRWEDAAENIRRIAENLLEMGRIRRRARRIRKPSNMRTWPPKKRPGDFRKFSTSNC